MMTAMYDARPWLRSYPAGMPAEAEFPRVPLTDLLDNAVRHYPRRTEVLRRVLRAEITAEVAGS